jgi:ketosteroid isomerase-like protein
MTLSPVEVVHGYRELVFADRYREALDFLSEDVEFVTPQGTMGYADIEQMWSEPPKELDHLNLEMRDAGVHELPDGRLLAEMEMAYTWRETGELSNVERRAALYVVENGKIQKLKFFVDPAQAWAEAGADRR